MDYDKPFKTYDEQIAIIESRNVIVSDYKFAKTALSNYSYYTLINGYKDTFLSRGNSNHFRDGVSFELLYNLHLVDSDLNNIIFKYILHIEKALKTKLAYIVGRDYGIHTNEHFIKSDTADYLHTKHYRRSRWTLNTLKGLRDDCINCRPNSPTYYYLHHKNHVPPWILANDITLGRIIQWYTILKSPAKQEICDDLIPESSISFEDKKEFLKKALDLLRTFRNGIAHGSKTFAYQVPFGLPKRQTLILGHDLINGTECNKMNANNVGFFAAVIAILLLLNDDRLIKRFYLDFKSAILQYGIRYDFAGKNIFEVFGLPENIIDRIKKYSENM